MPNVIKKIFSLKSPLIRLLIFVGVIITTIGIAQSPQIIHQHRGSDAALLFSILVAVAGLVLYCLLARSIEKRLLTEWSLNHSVRDFATGSGIGFLLFSLSILLLVIIDVANVDYVGNSRATIHALAGSLLAAVLEETLMRGIVFRIVEEYLGSWIALVISASMFGALHALNPGATVISSVAIALEAGVLLAAVYMSMRTLWMPIGLHFGWNFTEGGIFGASVSGGDGSGLMQTHLQGQDLLTGGAFGPEASMITVLVCFAAALCFLALAIKRQRVFPPFWRTHINRV